MFTGGILMVLMMGFSDGFRGPHHPRNDASHHHYSPQKDVKITQDSELLHDATHLKEDIGPMAEQMDFSNMTVEEIEFHYFKIHDIDNNAKLDGLEILYALQHSFHDDENLKAKLNYEDDFPMIVGLVDTVLTIDDLDHDGYLGYDEYVLGRQRDHITQARKDNKVDTDT
ncbi:multiple coagulation factor deficiency protein 2 homolog isoform X2 [Ceratina calcarata]|nr:multiple coagulation factor deficiency protein 2 homolog isoform X2 [Ceratina calcarata]XP_017878804.1 multiple coagulation factor deficiency protein 2 homolog isoform X2 [Ceratina calcarata]